MLKFYKPFIYMECPKESRKNSGNPTIITIHS